MKPIEGIALKQIIPQQQPFVLIDRLVSCDDVFTVTQLEVRDDNVFVKDGLLSAAGLVENVAQTCAAMIGYMNLLRGQGVKVGVIGAVNDFEMKHVPRVGDMLTTTIKVVGNVFQMTLVEASIVCEGEEIATTSMKIALTDIDAKN